WIPFPSSRRLVSCWLSRDWRSTCPCARLDGSTPPQCFGPSRADAPESPRSLERWFPDEFVSQQLGRRKRMIRREVPTDLPTIKANKGLKVRNTFFSIGIALLASLVVTAAQGSRAANESLWEAARAGDTTRITAALEQGADVNAKARYDVTALIFAASNGRLDAVRLLVARGADVNAQDTFYRARAAEMALTNGYADVAIFLVQNGSDADGALIAGVQGNQETLVKAALAGKVTRQGLQAAVSMAGVMKRETLVPLIKGALDKLPPEPAAPAFAVNPTSLPKYVGTY